MNTSFSSRIACACFLFLCLFNGAQAAATWGAEASVNATSGTSSDGGEMIESAFTSFDGGQASASLPGSIMLPLLGAEGYSSSGTNVGSLAVGMMGFTYSGDDPLPISLEIVLEGARGGTSNPDHAWVEANVAVVFGDFNLFITDYDDFISAVNAIGLFIYESNMSLDLNGGDQFFVDAVDSLLPLNTGDSFFVWASLSAGGIDGGFGDAFGTLSMSFLNDTRDINPAPGPGPDTDSDGVVDALDNCIEVMNANQRDTNADGFGNVCDADLDNDLFINFPDLNVMRQVFFTNPGSPNWNPDADFNGDNIVNFTDLNLMRTTFFSPPGPSGLAP